MTSHILRSNFDVVSRSGYKYLIVDLTDVTFFDSSGLSALVSGLRQMRNQGGTMVLAQPNDRIEATLRLTNFHRFFAIYDDINSAIRALTKPGGKSESSRSHFMAP